MELKVQLDQRSAYILDTGFVDASLFFPNGEDEEDEADEDDPDAKDDPIFQIDLKVWVFELPSDAQKYITEFLQNLQKMDSNSLFSLAQKLDPTEQQALKEILGMK